MKTPNRNENARFLTVQLAMRHFNLSRGILMEIANQANAVVRYGRVVRVDTKKMTEFLEDKCMSEV